MIYWSFEKLKGVKIGYSYHGISCWYKMSWKDDWEKQEPLVYQSIFALYWDFNATFISTKLSLRSRLPFAQVWEATKHIQKRRVKHRGKWGLFNSTGFPKLTALTWQTQALLRGQTVSLTACPFLLTHIPIALHYRTSQEHLAKQVTMLGFPSLSNEHQVFK